ncbi:MAG: hypothetical protein AAB463_00145 [Patescibacteria group bacterium]
MNEPLEQDLEKIFGGAGPYKCTHNLRGGGERERAAIVTALRQRGAPEEVVVWAQGEPHLCLAGLLVRIA